MQAPAAKKRKASVLSHDTPDRGSPGSGSASIDSSPTLEDLRLVPLEEEPVVFFCAGHRPDARLKVLYREFHVHSALLRIHSIFFRKQFEEIEYSIGSDRNSNMNQAASHHINTGALNGDISENGQEVRYSLVTTLVDNDKKLWTLVPATKVSSHLHQLPRTSKAIMFEEVHNFNTLLGVIYNAQYKVHGPEELVRLVDLAEHYGALPVLSRTLDGAFLRSPDFRNEIQYNAETLIYAATKLRHRALFRDCLIYLLGPHRNPRYLQLGRKDKIWTIARRAYGEICIEASNLVAHALEIMAGYPSQDQAKPSAAIAFKVNNTTRSVLLPSLPARVLDRS